MLRTMTTVVGLLFSQPSESERAEVKVLRVASARQIVIPAESPLGAGKLWLKNWVAWWVSRVQVNRRVEEVFYQRFGREKRKTAEPMPLKPSSTKSLHAGG